MYVSVGVAVMLPALVEWWHCSAVEYFLLKTRRQDERGGVCARTLHMLDARKGGGLFHAGSGWEVVRSLVGMQSKVTRGPVSLATGM